jgi:flagellar motor switch protein FliG
MSEKQAQSVPAAQPAPAAGGAPAPSTGEDRAAVLLKSLPGDLAEAVLGRLLPENAARLRERMKAAPAVGSAEAKRVLRGFVDQMRQLPPAAGGATKDEFVASPFAKAVLGAMDTAPVAPSKALEPAAGGVATADDVFDEGQGDPVAELRQLGPVKTAAVLRGERTPAIVVALSCLPMADASEVLKRLLPERRREATLRLARGAPGDAELQRAVARAVVRRGEALGDDPGALEGDAGARRMAELLRGLERDDRKEVLEKLTQEDPATAEKVKALLYVFEDLLRIEDRSVQALLAEVEMKTLGLALSGAEEAMATKVMNNLSQRARDTLTEEMGLLGKPRATAVRDARAQIVGVIQRLDSEGKLVMIE